MNKLWTKGFIMGYDKQILVDNAVLKAQDAILAAESNFENGFYSTCQNRLYYAIFYIVTALAYKNNFVTSKHSQLMGWFNKKYIYDEKIFDNKLLQIYKEAFTNRQKSDYDFTYAISKEDLVLSINETKDFVKTVENYLKNL